MNLTIRADRPGDEAAISRLITEAFATAPHSSGTEARIVDDLRSAGALTVSLIAEREGRLVGHVAFSPVTIAGANRGWFGLGPVAVLPGYQEQGIGAQLIKSGLGELRAIGAKGCVVLGDPGYYARFGFIANSRLAFAGPPPDYFQTLRFGDDQAGGEVAYHSAFSV